MSRCLCLYALPWLLYSCAAAQSWPRHVIDGASRGADGVRLGDINHDGLADITTGWEEGGMTRLYINPGPAKAWERWPAVTVGRTPDVEDAVFADLNADGSPDIVTSCEGSTRTLYVHWAPKLSTDLLTPSAWRQEPIGHSAGMIQFMFAVPLQLDGRNGIDLIVGGKGEDARIGWFESPDDASDAAAYSWHTIAPAGWVMSLVPCDMDGDGDMDIVTTDRKGPLRGCRWLENPGPGPRQAMPWPNHFIGARDWEVMFMDLADVDNDAPEVVVAARRDGKSAVLILQGVDDKGVAWRQRQVDFPRGAGDAKAVAVGDLNLDGRPDLVITCENAGGARSGVMWLDRAGANLDGPWTSHDISGRQGIKFDRIELLDLDADGDLDVVTTEENAPDPAGRRHGLGVIWYDNPHRSGPRQ